jgi:prepilin-type N-terminal cleavage/methylation domain-containing protein/prepilin-type processing-associated H-X9-DG protein
MLLRKFHRAHRKELFYMKRSYGLPSAKRQQTAFTLIELLVVIAIIAILAAILFPVFAQARAKARQAACVSNMKQISLGLRMYMDDYDGSTPAKGNSATDPQSLGGSTFRRADDPQSAPAILNPYIKNYAVWICPSDTTYGVDLKVGERNTYVFPVTATLSNNPAAAEDTASTTLVLNDNFSLKDYQPVGVYGNPGILSVSLRKYPHQNDSVNWAYLDGHVKVHFY